MKKHNVKHSKRIRKLVAICSLLAIFISVSTYAWFIGMKTVKVSSFDINIATTEGLFLSLNGVDWSYNLDVNEAEQYEGNANTFATDGLIPISTVGDMEESSSRMLLYEKSSLTAVPGGYRLLSSRIDNNVSQIPETSEYIEGKGYVAFDLFIKNLSGTEYYVDNDPKNEEAIYLNTNSAVTVADEGEEGTGIENSIRVAFAQIGRVKGDSVDAAEITGIDCEGTGDNVTGICRSASIWEPNDTKHVDNAINWYNKSCLSRKASGNTVTDPNSYNQIVDVEPTTCNQISDSNNYSTYAISKEISVADNVNVYDGADYNTYTANTIDYETYASAPEKTQYKLVDFPYFTDSDKMLTGADRPQFMSLAPNSITKVRVYIYLEGQDIDNYDFASLGKAISVNFGFTKERYTEGDIDYEGPSTDITPTPEEEEEGQTEHQQGV